MDKVGVRVLEDKKHERIAKGCCGRGGGGTLALTGSGICFEMMLFMTISQNCKGNFGYCDFTVCLLGYQD